MKPNDIQAAAVESMTEPPKSPSKASSLADPFSGMAVDSFWTPGAKSLLDGPAQGVPPTKSFAITGVLPGGGFSG
jgi:hypothetical protein